jgi:hypothetical protein
VSPRLPGLRHLTRRQLIGTGLGAFAGLAAAGVGAELIVHGVLPGKGLLNQIDGTCAVPSPLMTF